MCKDVYFVLCNRNLQTSPVAKLHLKLGWDQTPPQASLFRKIDTINIC